MNTRGPGSRVTNRILNSLTASDAASVLSQLELVPLNEHTVLFVEGAPMQHAYFPVSGLISLVTRVDSVDIESATVGAEGLLGLPIFLSEEVADCECVVQMPGEAWRIPAAAFLDLLESCPGLNDSLKRYTAASLWVTYRSAACAQVHSLARRTARWLLLAHDHALTDHFHLTHLLLAQMLGVRRAGVTMALGSLQRKGLIVSRRGRITILDRLALEQEACSCDALIRTRNNSSLL